jgi:hypothetical protein
MSGNAGAGTGAGNAGGSPDLLGGAAGGAGAGQGGSGGGQAGGDGGGAGGGASGSAKSWIDDLPEDIRGEASLKLHKDVGSLAKSYISAQKMIGADKIPVPGKHSTPDEWKQIFAKLGLPESPDKYEVKAQDGFNPELLGKFKKMAHEAGILPQQAEKVLEMYSEVNKNALETFQSQKKAKVAEKMGSLQKEWGEAFDQEMQTAVAGMNSWISEEEKAWMKENGLNTDPTFIKLMNKLGKAAGEGKIKGGGTGGRMGGPIPPAEAQSKMQAIMGDMSHPYFNAEHPGHKAAVDEMSKLSEYAYPSS